MKNTIVRVVGTLFGLMMFNAGLNKFLKYMPMPEMSQEAGALMGAFMEAGYLFPFIALVELTAGLLIITGRFSALGTLLMMPVTVNIFCLHAFLDPAGMAISTLLLAVNTWLLIEHKQVYKPLFIKSF